VGTVADIMQEWFEHGACDGWNVMPAYLPDLATEIFEWLVPELQRRVLFHTMKATARCAAASVCAA
jgi:N-acetyl-S-(2-succino)cysteine monooxygenase